MSNTNEVFGEYIPKETQREKILRTIKEQGFITKWGAIYNVGLHISKLSTRIGEIERKCGHKFVHETMYAKDGGKKQRVGTKYYVPAGLSIEDFGYKSGRA